MSVDAERLATYVKRVLPLAKANLTNEYYYNSLTLCVIDAVYSIGVRYEGVQAVVRRYCNKYAVKRYRDSRLHMPSIIEQEPISKLCERYVSCDPEFMAENVFCNKQRTSTSSGILKAEAVYRFALVIKNHGVEYLQEASSLVENKSFNESIRRIPGQASGKSLVYFYMLSGSDDYIKPDRMIIRFIESAIGSSINNISDFQGLARETVAFLRTEYPNLTPRLLDYEIWNYQRNKDAP